MGQLANVAPTKNMRHSFQMIGAQRHGDASRCQA